ncbi:hypothetical protein S245_030743 [Arachis hypogaea]
MASVRTRKSRTPRFWYMPTNFATDVLLDTPLSELAQHYQPKWMHETNQLEHVFVPIWEAVDTCYMLFLDVKGATLYVLDVSRSPKSIVRREANMRRITGILLTSDTQIRTLLIGAPSSILKPSQTRSIARSHLRGYCTGSAGRRIFYSDFRSHDLLGSCQDEDCH